MMTASDADAQPIGMLVDDHALIGASVAELLEDVCKHVYQAADDLEGRKGLNGHPDISVIVIAIAEAAPPCIRL